MTKIKRDFKKLCIGVLCLMPMLLFAANNQMQKSYEIEVSGISPALFLEIWDYEAEDHDRVKVTLNGTVLREFEIMHTANTITVPLLFVDNEAIVEIIGTFDGGGGVTYAVKATGIGTGNNVYKHAAGVGSGNSYRIIKKEDSLTKLWNAIWGDRKQEEEYVCRMGCTDGCKSAADKLVRSLRLEHMRRGLADEFSGLQEGASIGVDYVLGKMFLKGAVDMSTSGAKAAKKANDFRSGTGVAEDLADADIVGVVLGAGSLAGVPLADELYAGKELYDASAKSIKEAKEKNAEWKAYCQKRWEHFGMEHKKVKMIK